MPEVTFPSEAEVIRRSLVRRSKETGGWEQGTRSCIKLQFIHSLYFLLTL